MVKRYAVAVAFLAVLVGWSSLGQTSDPDIYWHLRTGESIVATRSTLPRDIFSFSANGQPWAFKDVVAEVLLYLGFSQWGYAWFAALKVATATAIGAASLAVVRPSHRHGFALLLGGGLILGSFWLVERPNLFAVALFPVELALLERAGRGREQERPVDVLRALAPVSAVLALWSALHPTALLGHLLFVACAGGWMLAGPTSRLSPAILGRRPSPRFVRVAVLLAALGPLLWALFPLGRQAMFGSVRFVATRTDLRQHILEWKRLPPRALFEAFPCGVTLVVVAIVVASYRFARAVRAREDDAPIQAPHVGLVIALALMTLTSVRWVPFAATAAGLVVAIASGELATRRPPPRGSSVLAGLLLLGLMYLRRGGDALRLGEDPTWSPRPAVTFARENGLAGDVVNSYEFGGYVMWSSWPSMRVLVDGRCEQVYSTDFLLRSMNSEHDARLFDEMRAQDRASWVIGVNRPGAVSYAFLAKDPRWMMVFWSDTAAVYALRSAHAELAPLAYRYVDPVDVPGSVASALAFRGADRDVAAGVLSEIRRMLAASPDGVRPNLALAAFLDAVGPSGWAERDAIIDRLMLLTHGAPAIKAVSAAFAAERRAP